MASVVAVGDAKRERVARADGEAGKAQPQRVAVVAPVALDRFFWPGPQRVLQLWISTVGFDCPQIFAES
ncbi:hypothetical protein D9M68_282140 [compost metagenome]